MANPKENLTRMKNSKIITPLMPERQGYGYELDKPIEVSSPHHQLDFIRRILPDHEGITNAKLIEFEREGAYKAVDRKGFVDKYELSFGYIKDEKFFAELFVLYFTFYPKDGESQKDFLLKVMTTKAKPPKGLIFFDN